MLGLDAPLTTTAIRLVLELGITLAIEVKAQLIIMEIRTGQITKAIEQRAALITTVIILATNSRKLRTRKLESSQILVKVLY